MSLVKVVPAQEHSGEYTLSAHKGTALTCTFGPNCLVSGGLDADLQLWNLSTLENTVVPQLNKSRAITATQFLDNTRLAAGFSDGAVHVVDIDSGSTVSKHKLHTMCVNHLDANATHVVSVGDDGALRVLNVTRPSEECVAELEWPLTCVALHNGLVYVSGIEPVVRCFDIDLRLLWELPVADSVTGIAVSDAQIVVKLLSGQMVGYYNSPTRPRENGVFEGTVANPEKMLVRCIIVQDKYVCAGAGSEVLVWDLFSRKVIASVAQHTGTVTDIAYQNGKLASASVDGNVVLQSNFLA